MFLGGAHNIWVFSHWVLPGIKLCTKGRDVILMYGKSTVFENVISDAYNPSWQSSGSNRQDGGINDRRQKSELVTAYLGRGYFELRLLDVGCGFRILVFKFWVSGFGFWVSGFCFLVSGFRFRFSGFGFRFSGFRLLATCFGFRFSGFGFRVSGLRCRVSCFGLLVSGFGFRVNPRGLICSSTSV